MSNNSTNNVDPIIKCHCSEFYDSCNNDNSFKYIIYLCHQSY